MKRLRWMKWLGVVVMGGMGGVGSNAWAEEKWANEVAAVEARLEKAETQPDGVLFTGSSSIRLWPLDRSFPGLGAINAGFGGSTLADASRYAERLVWRWRPRLVVLYAGDNDLANGLSPDEVVRDFVNYATSLHSVLPECRLIYLSIKPSASRWRLWPLAQEANARIRMMCEAIGEPRLRFVDVATPLLHAGGEPDPGLFADDRLHLNDAGYAKWQAVLGPVLRAGP